MKYKDACGEEQNVSLENSDIMLQKVANQWITALHRVSVGGVGLGVWCVCGG